MLKLFPTREFNDIVEIILTKYFKEWWDVARSLQHGLYLILARNQIEENN
jgi:hypothetical protein